MMAHFRSPFAWRTAQGWHPSEQIPHLTQRRWTTTNLSILNPHIGQGHRYQTIIGFSKPASILCTFHQIQATPILWTTIPHSHTLRRFSSQTGNNRFMRCKQVYLKSQLHGRMANLHSVGPMRSSWCWASIRSIWTEYKRSSNLIPENL